MCLKNSSTSSYPFFSRKFENDQKSFDNITKTPFICSPVPELVHDMVWNKVPKGVP